MPVLAALQRCMPDLRQHLLVTVVTAGVSAQLLSTRHSTGRLACTGALPWRLRALSAAAAAELSQSRPTLCNPSTVACQAPLSMGNLQPGILEWVIISRSRGSSQPRSPTLQEDSLPSEPPGKPRALLGTLEITVQRLKHSWALHLCMQHEFPSLEVLKIGLYLYFSHYLGGNRRISTH